MTDNNLIAAIELVDRIEPIARCDDWHRVLVGSDIRQLCGTVRRLIEAQALALEQQVGDVATLAMSDDWMAKNAPDARYSESLRQAKYRGFDTVADLILAYDKALAAAHVPTNQAAGDCTCFVQFGGVAEHDPRCPLARTAAHVPTKQQVGDVSSLSADWRKYAHAAVQGDAKQQIVAEVLTECADELDALAAAHVPSGMVTFIGEVVRVGNEEVDSQPRVLIHGERMEIRGAAMCVCRGKYRFTATPIAAAQGEG